MDHVWKNAHDECPICGHTQVYFIEASLHAAASREDLVAVLDLFDKLPMSDVARCATSTLSQAAVRGNVKIVKALLERGATDDEGKALSMACYFCHSEVEQLLLRTFSPGLAGSTDPKIQADFDQAWVAATRIQMKQVRSGKANPDELFVKRHVYAEMVHKYSLEPEDFAKLEREFRRNWRPSFEKGWERMWNDDIPQPSETSGSSNAILAVEADGLLQCDLQIGLAGWEEANLSVCLIDYALKNGLDESTDFEPIRAKAQQKYPTFEERRETVRKIIDILLAEQNRPNIYAPNKALLQKVRASLGASSPSSDH